MKQMTNVRIAPAPSTWEGAPEGFALVDADTGTLIAADFRPAVETYRRPFRLVAAGVMIEGSEVLRRFRDPLPEGLRLDPVAMSILLESGPHATMGLYAAAPPAGGGSSPYSEPRFYRTWGKMGGIPPADVEPGGYLGQKEAVEPGPALWDVVTGLLEHHGFTPKDLATFAAAPGVATSLAAAAAEVVQARHKALTARELAALQAKLVDKLDGWNGAAYASPNALSLFVEAVFDTVARAPIAKLPALVRLLAPQAPTEAIPEPASGAV